MRPVARFRAFSTIVVASGFAPLVAFGQEGGSPNPLMLSADLALFTAIVFLLLLAFLAKFAWKPVMDGLERRERGIADDIDTARKDREAAEAKLKEYESRLATARDEIATLHADAKRDIERMHERKKAEADAEAEARLRRAEAEIESAKKAALDDIAQRSVDMALSIASRVARKEIAGDQHAALIREALDRFPAGGGASSN